MHGLTPALTPARSLGEGGGRGPDSLERRKFLVAVGAGALAVTRSSLAQAQPKIARIGFLYFGSRQSTLDTGRYQAFVDGMRELGYVEGKNLVIETRFADGSSERVPALANELVSLKVDVIVAGGGSVYRALHHATKTIPVVSWPSLIRWPMAWRRAWRDPAGTSRVSRSARTTSARSTSNC